MSNTTKVLIAMLLLTIASVVWLDLYQESRNPLDLDNLRICSIQATDFVSLIESVVLTEETFLYAKSETVPRMWWGALLGLNESLREPLERNELEEKIRDLREESYVLPLLRPFLELDNVAVRHQRNARDFFLYLTDLCESDKIYDPRFQMDHVLLRAYASLGDPYSTYKSPHWVLQGESVEIVTHETRSEPVALTRAVGLSENQYLIKIISFDSSSVGSEVRALLEEVAERCRTPHIVLDLRDNLGGRMLAATDVVASLLGEGAVYTAQFRGGSEEPYISKAQRVPNLQLMSLLVLVNRRTASAAEVVTAALRERGAITVGENTYGKGVAQNVATLTNGGESRLTVFNVYSPSHETWHGEGITPRIDMHALTLEEVSPARRREIEVALGALAEDPGIVTSFRLIQESEAGTTSCTEEF